MDLPDEVVRLIWSFACHTPNNLLCALVCRQFRDGLGGNITTDVKDVLFAPQFHVGSFYVHLFEVHGYYSGRGRFEVLWKRSLINCLIGAFKSRTVPPVHVQYYPYRLGKMLVDWFMSLDVARFWRAYNTVTGYQPHLFCQKYAFEWYKFEWVNGYNQPGSALPVFGPHRTVNELPHDFNFFNTVVVREGECFVQETLKSDEGFEVPLLHPIVGGASFDLLYTLTGIFKDIIPIEDPAPTRQGWVRLRLDLENIRLVVV